MRSLLCLRPRAGLVVGRRHPLLPGIGRRGDLLIEGRIEPHKPGVLAEGVFDRAAVCIGLTVQSGQ